MSVMGRLAGPPLQGAAPWVVKWGEVQPLNPSHTHNHPHPTHPHPLCPHLLLSRLDHPAGNAGEGGLGNGQLF